MATTKVTFTLDSQTVGLLNDAARRLARPKSAVVRDAIQDFHCRIDRLSESERVRLLAAFDDLVPKIEQRNTEEVDREIREIRDARVRGGRRTPAE
jgi:predicted transcriptional regulator